MGIKIVDQRVGSLQGLQRHGVILLDVGVVTVEGRALVALLANGGGGCEDHLCLGEEHTDALVDAAKHLGVMLGRGDGTLVVKLDHVPKTYVPMHQIHVIGPFALLFPVVKKTQGVLGKSAVFRGIVDLGYTVECLFYVLVIPHSDGVSDENDFFHVFAPLMYVFNYFCSL